MSLAFNSEPLFSSRQSTALRDFMYEKFKRHITLLLEQKKTRKVTSRKGYLNPRLLHRHSFSDNIFQKRITSESSDTTIVFLIDGSGSMRSNEDTPTGSSTRIAICGAVASAFAKANRTVLKNAIPIEVFVKSAPEAHSESLTGTSNGAMVTLTRVFSSNSKVQDYDKLTRLECVSPITNTDSYSGVVGSYTSEYAVLPALEKWMKKNIRTKKCIVFNLTDGESYCSLGKDHYQFRDEDTKALRIKYLRGIPNVTLMLGHQYNGMGYMKDIYGDNVICASEDFSGALFKTFAGFLE